MTEQVIEYDVTAARIAELTQEKDEILGASEPDYPAIKAGMKRNGKLRIAVEKKRKELKSDALAYGRKIDEKAKEVSAPLIANEDAYKLVFNAHEAEVEAVRVEHNRKENARMAAIEERIENILSLKDRVTYNTTAAEVDVIIAEFGGILGEKFEYAEYEDKADEATKIIMDFLRVKFDERTAYEAEQAALAVQREKDNQERVALQAEKDAFEQEQKDVQAKIDAERAAMQKERDDLQQAKDEAAQAKTKAENARIVSIKDVIAMYTTNGIGLGFSIVELTAESDHLDDYLKSTFDFQEFKDEADAAYKSQREHIDSMIARRITMDNEVAATIETERLRVERVVKEEADRKASQAAEDRVRNAAPELLAACEHACICLETRGNEYEAISALQAAIKLAKGE